MAFNNMKLFSLFLVSLVALVHACPPPMNNWRFAGNSTHDSATMLGEAVINSNGWTDVVSNHWNPRFPWKVNELDEDGILRKTNIRYCFVTPTEYINFNEVIKAAWKRWEDKLGPPSDQTGHRLKFTPFEFRGPWKFCYNARKPDEPWVWNPEVPQDVVVIDNHYGAGVARATEGHIFYDMDQTYGRHRIWISKQNMDANPDEAAWQIAHELGHVFGLYHEHQRKDRDHYVHFECSNMQGYNELKERLRTNPIQPDHTIEKVCTDAQIGYQYGFMSPEFSTEEYIDGYPSHDGRPLYWWKTCSKEYDEDSIMHYHSFLGGDPAGDPARVDNKVLVMWKNRDADYTPPDRVTQDNADLIWPNKYVSPDDVSGIKYLYPWDPSKAPRRRGLGRRQACDKD